LLPGRLLSAGLIQLGDSISLKALFQLSAGVRNDFKFPEACFYSLSQIKMEIE
jgi:hypothetical protein